MQTEKEIIEKVLKEWEESHKGNLGCKNGWDASDIFYYLEECMKKALNIAEENHKKVLAEIQKELRNWMLKWGWKGISRECDKEFEEIFSAKIGGKLE